jgi:K+-sensing histidine kinase KdpD
MRAEPFQSGRIGYLVAALAIAVATAVLKLLGSQVNSTTVALALLLIVLFIATRWGSLPAVVASLLSMLCFNFFFLPPVHTFTIADLDNWIALAAFLITAVTAGELSVRVKRRAEEAEAGRREIERLYKELQEVFERASHAEALKQSERLKSALLDAVTHDLRTPLTSIKASVTTLLNELRKQTGEDQRARLSQEARQEMLEVVDEECDRLNHFVEGLIELARIEAGDLRLRWQWGNLEEIIANALVRTWKSTRNHEVKVAIEKELPAVRVDTQAVSEAIFTLIDNAAKYSQAGTSIHIIASRADDQTIRITVEDQGRGIPPQFHERVFDKFFRASSDSNLLKSQPSGLGMGLAIARGIVEAHGGRIWVEDSTSGCGTRITFTLPVDDDHLQQVGGLTAEKAEKVTAKTLALNGSEQKP